MTIDELITEAARAAHMAINAADNGFELRAETWSQVAQACAQTAQAMIMHEQHQALRADVEREELRNVWK